MVAGTSSFQKVSRNNQATKTKEFYDLESFACLRTRSWLRLVYTEAISLRENFKGSKELDLVLATSGFIAERYRFAKFHGIQRGSPGLGNREWR